MPGKLKYSKSTENLIKAVQLMAAEKGTSALELEQKLGLKRRTVFRLITSIKDELKFPVSVKREKSRGAARYYLPESCLSKISSLTVPRFSLSFNEILLLKYLFAHDTIFHDTEIAEDIQALKKKIDDYLPKDETEPSASQLDNFLAFSLTGLKSYEGKEDIIDTLMEALAHHISCRVSYRSPAKGVVKTYVIQPLKLVPHRGGLYVIVRIPKHDVINPLAVERIRKLELLKQVFTPPPDEKVNFMLNFAFDMTLGDPITAEIRFSPAVSPYILERRWSSRQTIKENKDGSCTLKITTSGKNDLLYWILSWGPEAKVLSPDSFRQSVKTAIEKMGEVYG
jgi:predicted DNA-binding transcriptional regulator YafY